MSTEVLKEENSVFYGAIQYDNGNLTFGSNPSATIGGYLNIATALSIYQEIYATDRPIPFYE